MKFLFVHQNFPGQFRHVASALANHPEHQVLALGEAHNLKLRPPLHPRVITVGYEPHGHAHRETHHYIRDFEAHIRRGQSVVRAALKIKEKGFRPDVVVAHPGWGEALFLKDVFPDARHINYFEYFYQGTGGDVGFDPEYPATLDDQLRVRVKNSTQLLSLVSCDLGISPTQWQKERFPAEFQHKIQVIHEGVDTQAIQPDPAATLHIGDHTFRKGDETVTYVARNLEPYRGFHVFMRSLPHLLQARPHARVVVVGGDEVSYGRRLPPRESYRAQLCKELENEIDWSRVHFVGKLPYAQYLQVLQVSAAHVYLTYPFVLSWSMLEAMAAGCTLVASNTTPVQEVLTHGHNGLLVDFFDHQRLAHQLAEVLANPQKHTHLGKNARSSVVQTYDLQQVCLPRWLKLIQLDWKPNQTDNGLSQLSQ